jgi:energy-converting hydrogenase Eha subunit E
MAVRVLAGLCAVSWLVFPGFGVIDLSVTWSADWPQVLEAGWGLFATVIVGAAFVLVGVRPRGSAPAVAHLLIAIVALAISAVFAKEGRLLALVAFLALQTAIVGGLLRGARPGGRDSWAPRPVGVSRPLLVVACAGVVPWLSYALQMWALNRDDRSDSDVTIGVDHYSVQGALALSLGLLPLLAALRAEVRPFVPVCASVAAFYLGLVSLAWPHSPGGLSRTWSAAAVAWALVLAAVALARRRRTAPLPQRSASAGRGVAAAVRPPDR